MEEKGIFEIRENCLLIRMPEEVDHHIAKTIRRYADHYLLDERVQQIVFDFADTIFMDSSGIGLLSGRNAKIAYFGGRTIVINANDRIRKLLKIAGLQDQVCIMDEI